MVLEVARWSTYHHALRCNPDPWPPEKARAFEGRSCVLYALRWVATFASMTSSGGQLLTAGFLFITGIEHHRYMLADEGRIAPLPTVPTTEKEAEVAMSMKVVASAGAEWGGLPIKATAWCVPLKRTLQHADPTF